MRTYSAKPETVERDWYVVDATDRPLGRLASEIARRLRGKHKPVYTPHVDTGDYIIVINAKNIGVTGNKRTDEDVLPALGLPGWDQVDLAGEAARQVARAGARDRGQRHATQRSTGPGHVPQAPGLRRRRAQARCPATKTSQHLKPWHKSPIYSTGRRKTSTARVYLKRGSGNITVNKRALDDYFGRETARMIVRQPLETVDMRETFDIDVRVHGGGR